MRIYEDLPSTCLRCFGRWPATAGRASNDLSSEDNCGFNGWPLGCTGTVADGGSRNAVSNNGININSHEFIVIVLLQMSNLGNAKFTKTASTSSTNLRGSHRLLHFCRKMMLVANLGASLKGRCSWSTWLQPANLRGTHRLPHVCAIVRPLHVSYCRIFALAQM